MKNLKIVLLATIAVYFLFVMATLNPNPNHWVNGLGWCFAIMVLIVPFAIVKAVRKA